MATTSPVHPQVTILVLNWNLPVETIACVESLLVGDYSYRRIAVIDNGSTDNSVTLLRDHLGARATILQVPENLYYAGGNNVGLRWALDAGADWVMVLNNDTIVAPDMVSLLVRAGAASPDVGIVGPTIYWGDQASPTVRRSDSRRKIWAMGSSPPLVAALSLRLWQERDRSRPIQPSLQRGLAVGCCMMINRQALARVGLFHPAYRMYYEDAGCAHTSCRLCGWLLSRGQAGLASRLSQRRAPGASVLLSEDSLSSALLSSAHNWDVDVAGLCDVGWPGLARVVLHWVCGAPDLAAARWRGLCDGFREQITAHASV